MENVIFCWADNMKITKTELRSAIRKALIEAHKNRFNFSRDPYGEDWVGPAGMSSAEDNENAEDSFAEDGDADGDF